MVSTILATILQPRPISDTDQCLIFLERSEIDSEQPRSSHPESKPLIHDRRGWRSSSQELFNLPGSFFRSRARSCFVPLYVESFRSAELTTKARDRNGW